MHQKKKEKARISCHVRSFQEARQWIFKILAGLF